MQIYIDIKSVRRVLVSLCFILLYKFTYAQQDPQFSHSMFNKFGVNPGVAGSNDGICANLINRQQWIGFDGNPKTTIFNVHSPVSFAGREHGVGLSVLRDVVGFETAHEFKLSYSYKIELGDGVLGAGVRFGMLNKMIDLQNKKTPNDLVGINGQDPLVPTGKNSFFGFDMGLGAFYKTDQYYAGISTTHITSPNVKYDDVNTFQKTQFYIMAGYEYELNPEITLLPSLFIKTEGVTAQYDINALAEYNKRFWGGVTYRVGDAVIPMVGMKLDNGINVGYSYDITTSKIRTQSSGSHEFMVGYCFKIEKTIKRSKYGSVRFL